MFLVFMSQLKMALVFIKKLRSAETYFHCDFPFFRCLLFLLIYAKNLNYNLDSWLSNDFQ